MNDTATVEGDVVAEDEQLPIDEPPAAATDVDVEFVGMAKSTELGLRPTREALTPIDPEQVVASMQAYQALLPRLLEHSDFQDAGGGKKFVKRSGWRKIARAFATGGEASDELRQVARNALGYLLDGDVTAADELVERLLAEFGDRFPIVAGQTIVIAATAIKQHREARAREASAA